MEGPAVQRPLKGGFAAAFGDGLRPPLTDRWPPGWGSACGLSRDLNFVLSPPGESAAPLAGALPVAPDAEIRPRILRMVCGE